MLDGLIQGTKRVLDFAIDCNAERFLLVSSGAVYGEQPSEITNIQEDFQGSLNPIEINSVYGFGKSISELLCVIYAREHNLNTKIARCFAFVGPHLPLDSHFAIGNFIRDGLRGGPIVVKGDGSPYRSYLYAADLTVWLWNILFRGESCRPYNVGSDIGITIGELAKNVSEAFQKRVEVKLLNDTMLKGVSERYVPSIQRAKLELGLEQKIDLRESIRRTIIWYLRNT
jgi:dTDP-glucose 4,6-dehydratase